MIIGDDPARLDLVEVVPGLFQRERPLSDEVPELSYYAGVLLWRVPRRAEQNRPGRVEHCEIGQVHGRSGGDVRLLDQSLGETGLRFQPCLKGEAVADHRTMPSLAISQASSVRSL